MELGFYELFSLFCFATALAMVMCIFMIVAFSLGAYVVFRTKRDATEPFLGHTRTKETASAGQAPAPDDMEPSQLGKGPPQYGAPEDEEEIPMGGDVGRRIYNDERVNRFLSDFQMHGSQGTEASPQRVEETEEGERQ